MIPLILDDLKAIQFGARTFTAAHLPFTESTITGLPLTPNSIKIFGLFQKLKRLSHLNLCLYLDIQRRRNERLIVVSEHYSNNLTKKETRWTFKNDKHKMTKLIFDIVQALSYLHEKGIVHRCLNPSCIEITPEGRTKLSNFGLYHMTKHGQYVSFPVGDPMYLAPEVISEPPNCPENTRKTNPSSDIWALGLILLEIYLDKPIFERYSLEETFGKVYGLLDCNTGAEVVESLLSLCECSSKLREIPKDIRLFIENCLTPDTSNRHDYSLLLQSPILEFFSYDDDDFNSRNIFHGFLAKDLKCKKFADGLNPRITGNNLAYRKLPELYYLWQIASSDIEPELQKSGLICCNPPVTTLPGLIFHNGECYPKMQDKASQYDDVSVALSFDILKERLLNVNQERLVPLFFDKIMEGYEEKDDGFAPIGGKKQQLPPIILERNVEHQLRRFFVFERLINAYPFTRKMIVDEARHDVPPLYRPYIWAALLGVSGDIQGEYETIDKVTPTPTDRQIEVDIPRCHQYDELLSSPLGHATFKRVLKAWLTSHPEYVYWQGNDSLCAPFIRLNFNNEALAYFCVKAFINKYLRNFFQKDNSAVIKEYLSIFSHLLAYHDVELYNHLTEIGFVPDLYAIPWFLTMYTHVFPLHKVFHVWDTLLLGDSSIPLFFGIAILRQLRNDLLSYQFNDCILLFSDMPEIFIEHCVRDCIELYNITPPSASFRKSACEYKKYKFASSKEYHHLEGMGLEDVELSDLQSEACPRILYQDLMAIMDPASPMNMKVMVIDVRPSHKYNHGTLPEAINMPFESAFSITEDESNSSPDFYSSPELPPSPELNSSPEASCLVAHKGDMVVVAGSKSNQDAANFAARLVAMDFPKVLIFHGGIEPLGHSDNLVYPTL